MNACPMCASSGLEEGFAYTEPPPGETAFDLPDGQEYARSYLHCGICGHYVQVTDIDLDSALYSGAYVDATYRSAEGMREAFERIMALPPGRSDNALRAERVDAAAAERGLERVLLDVGSGLGVFPTRMRERGWDCSVVDPDPRAVAFATDELGLAGTCGDFMAVEPPRRYPLVTFNKVLEHVGDPVAMLARTRAYLADGGMVYVEVPDGQAAALDPDGPARE